VKLTSKCVCGRNFPGSESDGIDGSESEAYVESDEDEEEDDFDAVDVSSGGSNGDGGSGSGGGFGYFGGGSSKTPRLTADSISDDEDNGDGVDGDLIVGDDVYMMVEGYPPLALHFRENADAPDESTTIEILNFPDHTLRRTKPWGWVIENTNVLIWSSDRRQTDWAATLRDRGNMHVEAATLATVGGDAAAAAIESDAAEHVYVSALEFVGGGAAVTGSLLAYTVSESSDSEVNGLYTATELVGYSGTAPFCHVRNESVVMLRWHREYWVIVNMGEQRDRFPGTPGCTEHFRAMSSSDTPPVSGWESGVVDLSNDVKPQEDSRQAEPLRRTPSCHVTPSLLCAIQMPGFDNGWWKGRPVMVSEDCDTDDMDVPWGWLPPAGLELRMILLSSLSLIRLNRARASEAELPSSLELSLTGVVHFDQWISDIGRLELGRLDYRSQVLKVIGPLWRSFFEVSMECTEVIRLVRVGMADKDDMAIRQIRVGDCVYLFWCVFLFFFRS
jgi:hypothetical protein